MSSNSDESFVSPALAELRLPDPRVNNVWYLDRKTDATLVFVHGIFSDSRSCWLHEGQPPIYWPDLISRDSRFDRYSLYLGGYYTALDSGAFKVQHCADHLYRALGRSARPDAQSVLERATIVFVCHSTGGIVVRYLLESRSIDFKEKTVGLVLIASPSFGSAWATKLSLLSKFYKVELARQLEWGNNSLDDLDERFHRVIKERRIPGLHGVEAYEHHFIFHRKLLPDQSVIVDKNSAGRYFPPAHLLPQTNHFTSVKPDSERHPSHELLVDFCTELERKRPRYPNGISARIEKERPETPPKSSSTESPNAIQADSDVTPKKEGIPDEILRATNLISSAVKEDRRRGVRALVGMDSAASTEGLVLTLNSGYPDVRLLAAMELARRRDDRAIKALVQGLATSDKATGYWDPSKTEIFPLLESFGDAVISDIGSLIQVQEPQVRAMAAVALGHIGGESAIQYLKSALKDENTTVKGHAIDAVAKIKTSDPSVVQELIALLSDSTEITHNEHRKQFWPKVSDTAYIALCELKDPVGMCAADEYKKANAEYFKEVKEKVKAAKRGSFPKVDEFIQPGEAAARSLAESFNAGDRLIVGPVIETHSHPNLESGLPLSEMGWHPDEISLKLKSGLFNTDDILSDSFVREAFQSRETQRRNSGLDTLLQPPNGTKYLVVDASTPFLDISHFSVTLQETQYFSILRARPAIEISFDTKRKYSHIEPSKTRVPQAMAIQFATIFADQQLLTIRRSKDAFPFPGKWSFSAEEQCAPIDLSWEEPQRMKYFLLRTAVEEIFPLARVLEREKLLEVMRRVESYIESMRIWSLFLEEPTVTFSLFAVFKLNLSAEEYAAEVRKLVRRVFGQKSPEGNYFCVTLDEAPRLLRGEIISAQPLFGAEREDILPEEMHPTSAYRIRRLLCTRHL